jgi:hypothetical protein
MNKFNLIFGSIFCMLLENGIAQASTDTLKAQALPKDSVLSQIDDFRAILLDSYLGFDTARTYGNMVIASNRLKLIANKWNDQWAPQYYASYMLTVLSFIEKDASKRDSYIDEAEGILAKAKNLFKKNYDELFVLEAMMASARLSVKPGSRYKKFGEIFDTNIDSAKNLNPENPRIYYLQGNSIFYTPKLFGGGASKALPYYEKAETLFQKESKADIFKPYWGQKQNETMLKKCKE